jgi:hypothetical protein
MVMFVEEATISKRVALEGRVTMNGDTARTLESIRSASIVLNHYTQSDV